MGRIGASRGRSAPRGNRRRAVRQRIGKRDREFMSFDLDTAQVDAIRRDLKAMGRDLERELPAILTQVMQKPKRIMQQLAAERIGQRVRGEPRSTGTTAASIDHVVRTYAGVTGRRVWVGVGVVEGSRPNVASSKDLSRSLVHGWLEFGSRNARGGRVRKGKRYVRDVLRRDPVAAQVKRAMRLGRRLIDRRLRAPTWQGSP